MFKEIHELYPDAKWVSGNAEKAGYLKKNEGDDTLGYDIKYTDSDGCVQLVEELINAV